LRVLIVTGTFGTFTCGRRERYLSLAGRDDTIEVMDPDGDRVFYLVGWDIYKTLRLYADANPALMEWLQCPLYRSEGNLLESLAAEAVARPSLREMAFHYSGFAKSNWYKYLSPDKRPDRVPVKKYLYVVRPLVALCYIHACKAPPPLSLPGTLDKVALVVGKSVWQDITRLIQTKRESREISEGPRLPTLDTWITESLKVFDSSNRDLPSSRRPPEAFDNLLFSELGFEAS
jgi:predicted nucleotidyltransferase